MEIKIHRGLDQIGGCITEIWTDTSRVFIDFGQNCLVMENLLRQKRTRKWLKAYLQTTTKTMKPCSIPMVMRITLV